MANVLDAHGITWKYYAPWPGTLWNAPNAIKAICKPQYKDSTGNPDSELKCTGKEWTEHVDVRNVGTDILRDIASCSLPQVTWVIPNGPWSDHPSTNDDDGPSWVASVINAIGNNPRCPLGTPDAGQIYWQNTAIVVTWDDWGGWSDHEPPPLASQLPCTSSACQGDYQYGFRVPLLVVSAYTPAGLINNYVYDFGSILRMIEGVNHLTEGQLGFADRRSATDLHSFFPLTTPRKYKTVPALKNASFFLSNMAPAVAPDDE